MGVSGFGGRALSPRVRDRGIGGPRSGDDRDRSWEGSDEPEWLQVKRPRVLVGGPPLVSVAGAHVPWVVLT